MQFNNKQAMQYLSESYLRADITELQIKEPFSADIYGGIVLHEGEFFIPSITSTVNYTEPSDTFYSSDDDLEKVIFIMN